MLKVVIADDEERICRLICAIIDWQAAGFEIVGKASNGLEAIDMVKTLKPDLLITDIRMPGCDGLQLIETVKTAHPQLEIIVISGYAHFSFAQTALRFGVGDYLLKPINKAELLQTVTKIHEKITARTQMDQEHHQLILRDQQAKATRRENLCQRLCQDNAFSCTWEILQTEYDENFRAGMLQGFCLKADYDSEIISRLARDSVFEKAQHIMQGNLKSNCHTLLCNVNEDYLYGVLNFAPSKQADVQRTLRDCLNQLVMQKSMLGPITITIACGQICKDPNDLASSMQKSIILMQERLVLGTERVLDTMPRQLASLDGNLMEQYTRQIAHACETFHHEEARNAVATLKGGIVKNTSGAEISHLVQSAGTVFLMQRNLPEQAQVLQQFHTQCSRCSTVEGLFACLQYLQEQVISQLQTTHDLESMRPIRLAKQYIQNHYAEPITLELVSEVVGLSPTYFSAVFKKETEEGFAKYLIRIRIEHAKSLLRDTNESVASICELVGYHDLKHFTHTFTKETGLKPSAYRKLYG